MAKSSHLEVLALGTTNPGKIEACEKSFNEWHWPKNEVHNFSVTGLSTPSGVSEQPMGLEETMLGAKNRAKAALEGGEGAKLGIGLESGLVVVDGLSFDFCACCIFDGVKYATGMSSMWALPPKVSSALAEKRYNKAFEDIGVSPDDRGDGVLSQLSCGKLSRPKQMRESVDAALLQLSNPDLW
eukprot:TRINITY_DN78646_c0_g1_i1.p1 TRINITY_DN78646_c0_g1~~TRINITY_DN78646_c0_g1_i1.p1  ORF type:complete len:184 (+),score=36.06 TRINITY_DN78646_c0_g1_i1:40-591(+)